MTKTILKYAIGIDISKADFKVCFVGIDADQHITVIGSRTFSNSKTGFDQFHNWITAKRKDKSIYLLLAVEATGVYYENLAFFLCGKDIR